jgi:hypothetical protein
MTVNRKLMAQQLDAIKSAANYGHWHEVLKHVYLLHNQVLTTDNRLRRARREITRLRALVPPELRTPSNIPDATD